MSYGNFSYNSRLTTYGRIREQILNNCEGGSGSTFFTVSSFTISKTQAEVGEAIINLVLNWTYSPTGTDPISQSIDHGVGSISTSLRAANTGPVDTTLGSSKTWTLSAIFSTNSTSANVTVNFRRKRYWGVSTNPDIGTSAINLETPTTAEDSIVASFSNEFASSRLTVKNFNCTGGRYIYHLWPASFGIASPQWKVNTFPVELNPSNIRLVDLTNIHGNTTEYYITRSDNLLHGSSVNVEVL